jgi:hypothetical protein
MLAANIPVKVQLPFGTNAGPSYIRNVPIPSQIGITTGAASFNDGFPPSCFQANGYPFGQDFNGLLRQVTQWLQWTNAGAPVGYDATFSTAIGGYPQGAIISAAILGNFWFCTIDNNLSNPDTGGAGWIGFSPLGQATRIITASGAFATNLSDGSLGFNRTSGVAISSTTLPVSPIGKIYNFEDLAGNFNPFPVTVTAPGGQTFSEGAGSITFNENNQAGFVRYYGSNLWSYKK